jgi:hypothetical protein
MVAAPVTGVEAVDRELKRRSPFPDAETAEVVANQLLAVWRALQPSSSAIYATTLRARRRKQSDQR